MKFYVLEYNKPEQNPGLVGVIGQGLHEVSESDVNMLLTSFKREQRYVNPQHLLNYARKNPQEVDLNTLFDENIVTVAIHQDSERDLLFVLD